MGEICSALYRDVTPLSKWGGGGGGGGEFDNSFRRKQQELGVGGACPPSHIKCRSKNIKNKAS